jgi:hypothetical protein
VRQERKPRPVSTGKGGKDGKEILGVGKKEKVIYRTRGGFSYRGGFKQNPKAN